MKEVTLSRIVYRDGEDRQHIFLSELEGKRAFLIVIGNTEASEIQRIVHGEEPERPLTHQLTYTAIQALGGELEAVEIVDLKHNTFYARILLKGPDGTPIPIDARPSDAIALALRARCTIRATEEVLDRANESKGP